MPHHMLRTGRANPFTAHRLDGWNTPHTNVRFPVTFATYEEGDNLGLYLAPAGLAGMHEALALPSDDIALVLESDEGSGLLRWGDVDVLEGEVEVVHLPAGADAWAAERRLPSPLLAHPEEAVPADLGSRVALSLHDGCHGTLLTRDRALVVACLRGFLGDFQVAVLGRGADLPPLTDELLFPLAQPLAPGAWWGLQLRAGRRYWALDLSLHDQDGLAASTRWVSEGEHGRWRSGWDW